MAYTDTQLIKDTVAFLRKTWPDIALDQGRIDGWIAEVEAGGGRTGAELKSDILVYVVGEERIREYVALAFSERGLSANDTRINRIINEIVEGRSFSELNTTLDKFGTRITTTTDTDDGDGGVVTPAVKKTPATDPDPPPPPEGNGEGVMSGGKLVRIRRKGISGEGADDFWAMAYLRNGVTDYYFFDSYDSMITAMGNNYQFTDIDEGDYDKQLNDGTGFDMGSAQPLVAQSIGYGTFMSDIEKNAAIDAGIRNPGMLKKYLSDPEIRKIIARAELGDWTEDREAGEIRNTDFYRNVLYPGIIGILESGVPNPEAVWWQYHNDVEDNLAMLGYGRDDDGTYRSQIGKMMGMKISDSVFNQMAPQFQRAATSPEFAVALDYWMDKTAGRDVNFDDVFDAMSGQSEGDLAVAVESAVIQFQSDLSGTTLSSDQITRIASMTELNEAQIATAFTTAEEALLNLGDRGLKRYGLSEQALVSSAFGLKEGSDTAEEIRRLAAKTSRELSLEDDRKAQFYASFNERGSLIKPGLSALSPESG